jgi:TonB family protein
MRQFCLTLITVLVPLSAHADQATPDPVTVTAPPRTSSIIERNKLVIQKFYPRTSLRRGEEGEVHFRINVNKDGRLDGCQITRSSGYEALDTATCDMLLKGATATPLIAEDGWRTAGVRDGIVPWVLPDGAKRPATPPPLTSTRNSAGEKLICRRQTKTGSTYIMEKVCLTAADWKRAGDEAQRQTQEMQTCKGPTCAYGGGG